MSKNIELGHDHHTAHQTITSADLRALLGSETAEQHWGPEELCLDRKCCALSTR